MMKDHGCNIVIKEEVEKFLFLFAIHNKIKSLFHQVNLHMMGPFFCSLTWFDL